MLLLAVNASLGQEKLHRLEKSFQVIDLSNNKTIKIDVGNKFKVIKKANGWAYEIKLFDKDNNPVKGNYLVSTKWAKKAVVKDAIIFATRSMERIATSTQPPKAIFCNEVPKNIKPDTKYNSEDPFALAESVFANFKRKCKYKVHFNQSDVENLCRNMNNVLYGRKLTCHTSNCATASYIGFLNLIKNTPLLDKIGLNNLACEVNENNDFAKWGKAYIQFKEGVTIKDMVSKYNIGHFLGKVQPHKANKLDDTFATGYPRPRDLLFMQRFTPPKGKGTGHTAFFSHYKFDFRGKINYICYVTSGRKHKGVGPICEDIDSIDYIDIVRLDI